MFYIRCVKNSYLLVIALIMVCQASAQLSNIPALFAAIPQQPNTLSYSNTGKAPAGGHLQGIQVFEAKNGTMAILTGSSAGQSYYLNAPLGDTGAAQITVQHKIFDSPYRHAGGCQLSGDVMAVGVEDNMAKDKAKIVLVNVRDDNAIPVIERKGTYERSTAGAVGYARLKSNRYMMAVGDWDSKHIDFYLSQQNNVANFDLLTTYNADTTATWGSYQSINLLSDTSGKLYLIGFCKHGTTNRADLFRIEWKPEGVKVLPVASRYFASTHGISFRYGAGVHVTANNTLQLVACARNLKRGKNYINLW